MIQSDGGNQEMKIVGGSNVAHPVVAKERGANDGARPGTLKADVVRGSEQRQRRGGCDRGNRKEWQKDIEAILSLISRRERMKGKRGGEKSTTGGTKEKQLKTSSMLRRSRMALREVDASRTGFPNMALVKHTGQT